MRIYFLDSKWVINKIDTFTTVKCTLTYYSYILLLICDDKCGITHIQYKHLNVVRIAISYEIIIMFLARDLDSINGQAFERTVGQLATILPSLSGFSDDGSEGEILVDMLVCQVLNPMRDDILKDISVPAMMKLPVWYKVRRHKLTQISLRNVSVFAILIRVYFFYLTLIYIHINI